MASWVIKTNKQKKQQDPQVQNDMSIYFSFGTTIKKLKKGKMWDQCSKNYDCFVLVFFQFTSIITTEVLAATNCKNISF